MKDTKVAAKKTAENLIEYKEKAIHYELTANKNKELENEIKILKNKVSILDDSMEKFQTQGIKSNSRTKEL